MGGRATGDWGGLRSALRGRLFHGTNTRAHRRARLRPLPRRHSRRRAPSSDPICQGGSAILHRRERVHTEIPTRSGLRLPKPQRHIPLHQRPTYMRRRVSVGRERRHHGRGGRRRWEGGGDGVCVRKIARRWRRLLEGVERSCVWCRVGSLVRAWGWRL